MALEVARHRSITPDESSALSRFTFLAHLERPRTIGGEVPDHHQGRCEQLRTDIMYLQHLDRRRHGHRIEREAHNRDRAEFRKRLEVPLVALECYPIIQTVVHESTQPERQCRGAYGWDMSDACQGSEDRILGRCRDATDHAEAEELDSGGPSRDLHVHTTEYERPSMLTIYRRSYALRLLQPVAHARGVGSERTGLLDAKLTSRRELHLGRSPRR